MKAWGCGRNLYFQNLLTRFRNTCVGESAFQLQPQPPQQDAVSPACTFQQHVWVLTIPRHSAVGEILRVTKKKLSMLIYHCTALRPDYLACLQGVPVAMPPTPAAIDASTGGPLQLAHVLSHNAIPRERTDISQPVMAPAAHDVSATAQVLTAPILS